MFQRTTRNDIGLGDPRRSPGSCELRAHSYNKKQKFKNIEFSLFVLEIGITASSKLQNLMLYGSGGGSRPLTDTL